MSQALKRLKIMAALSKHEIEATINTMAAGLGELGEVKVATALAFNIGGTEAKQSFYVQTSTRAVSNYFLARGFRHISAGMMRKGIGDSLATVTLIAAGGYGTSVTLKVYSAGSA
jgi:hypothetical protein